MRHFQHELFIRVNDRIVDEYRHDGKIFIEGRKGSNYSLDIRNDYFLRRKCVISVDGLNIMTGDTNWESGYVIEPKTSIVIPGWRIDETKVADFKFSAVGKSYNQHNDSGDKNNVGVIGCMVFDEVQKYDPPIVQYYTYHNHYPTYPILPTTYWPYGTAYGSSIGLTGSSFQSSSISHSSGTLNAFNSTLTGGAESSPQAKSGLRSRTKTADEHIGIACAAGPVAPDFVQQNSIGTEWGNEHAFKTSDVYFDFLKQATASLLIYYDDRRGLERRGVNLARKQYSSPNAFPGMRQGCPYPK